MYILASESPRRKELLSKIVSEFKIIPSTIDESKINTESYHVKDIPEFLSTKKALDVFESFPDDIIIAADTAIIFDNKIYGKPKDQNDARSMLKAFSNNTHQVITGVCIISKEKSLSFSSINEVTFYNLSEKDIDEYLSLNEYKDKAGSYAIQGRGTLLIKHISGDYNSIIGLPIGEIKRLLEKFF